jgi:two-component sensor histidine kinase
MQEISKLGLIGTGLYLLMLFPAMISGQAHELYTRNQEKLEELLAAPEKFTPTQRTEIYLNYASGFFSTDLDSAKTIFREMQVFGATYSDLYVQGTALNSMAMLYQMEGNYDSAIVLFRKALPFVEDYPANMYEIQGALGNVLMLTNQLDSAAKYIDQSLLLARELNDTSGFASAYQKKGVLFNKQERFHAAISQFLKALEFSDHADVLPLRKANTYQLIASSYHQVGDDANAIRYATHALEIARREGYQSMQAEMDLALGGYYQHQQAFPEAQRHYASSLPYHKERGLSKALIAAYSNLAQIAMEEQDPVAAQLYLDAAKPHLNADMSAMHKAVFYQAQGQVAFGQGNYTQSLISFDRVLDISKSTGTVTLALDAYSGLIKTHRRLGQYKEALQYSDSLMLLNERLDLAFQNRTILDLESKYESNLKNEEIAKLNAEQEVQTLQLDKKQTQLLYTMTGLILALVSISALWYAFSTKSRSNKILETRNAQLSEALTNNKILIKEIHHRVKNNLQVVSSLLNLQSRFETDSTILRAISTGKYRVQAMSLLHQNLYQNEDLKSIAIKNYFEDLAGYLVKGYPLNGKDVKLTLDIDDLKLDVDTVVPMGLISNELITNALKYAYGETADCKLHLSIKEAHGKIRLIVKDNGIGTPFTQLPEKSSSMGTQLIKSFAHKLKATVEIDNFEGAEIKLTFAHTDHKEPLKMLRNVAS